MLSLGNLGRRKIRTILTVVSITIGVAIIVSLLSIILLQLVKVFLLLMLTEGLRGGFAAERIHK